jgi:hypothetical protein
MLHELSHIVHGPHDAKFHALWNQLRDEHEGLARKGYTGEGFLSTGHRLGGQRIPMSEARRLARAAAEKRRVLSAGSGQRLGGGVPRPGEDIRKVIVNAIERRNQTLQGCGNTSHNEKEIRDISDTASRNGFRTQAEEDAANEAAIAQALWELVQEDEKAKYGNSYIPPSAENPAGSGGLVATAGSGNTGKREQQAKQDPRANRSRPQPAYIDLDPEPSTETPDETPASPGSPTGWTCGICTLHNPASFLCCDACGTERPEEVTRQVAKRSAKPSRVASTKPSRAVPPPPAPAATWQCSFCGNMMERQWWTCSVCGKMKDNSS